MDRVFLEDGTPINPLGADFIDLGLGAFLAARPEWALLASSHEGKFKVPTVRNVDQRPIGVYNPGGWGPAIIANFPPSIRSCRRGRPDSPESIDELTPGLTLKAAVAGDRCTLTDSSSPRVPRTSVRMALSVTEFCVRTVSHAPRNHGQTPSFTGTCRRISMLREVVDRECVGGF